MKRPLLLCILLVLALTIISKSYAQTSWTGNINTNWNNSGNWTAGVPTSTTNTIIGDANFTGVNQPTVNISSSCNSITIGGTVPTTFTLSKNLVVNGNFIIDANGSVAHPNSTLTVKGNWTNNGNYTTSNINSKIVFGGNAQTFGGSSVTIFRKATVNTGTVLTLAANMTLSGAGSYLNINGTIDPGQLPTYTITSSVAFKVFNGGKININAASFAANYNLSGSVTLSPGSTVEYSSTAVNQVVSSDYSYSTLIINGTGTKSLAANLPVLNSSATVTGNIIVKGGTFDLGTYTASRGTSTTGGEFSLYNGAFLKIGGSSNFPANYNTRSLALASTVEYNGTAQNVSPQTYGNLILSSGSGASTKTFPATAFIVEGNFTSTIGSGTAVNYTTASDVTINGNVNIGASTIFNGNTNTHSIRGNWVNNGTFTGSTSTISFDGPSTSISGTGTHDFNNINFSRSAITATCSSINVSGNIASNGSGTFTHSAGLITMTGTSKTITGTNIVFDNLTISGSVSSASAYTINSNFIVSGSFSGSGGEVTMPGTSKTISGVGNIVFGTLLLDGSITTATNFSISTSLVVNGSFSATAGTATFTGTSILTGTANLYNVTINGTSLQLSFLSVLGIANTLTVAAGVLDVTSSIPNTVNFNGPGAQNVNAIAFHHLTLSNGNTKTAAGNITVNGNMLINTATTFNGGSYTHTVLRNWVNSGAYTASSGTVQFSGLVNATISGATNFNSLAINKSTGTTNVSLLSNVNAATVNMTSGTLITGNNTLTITNTRLGNGIILGTITRTHSFTTATAYAFEGPDNSITFSAVSGVSSVTVVVTKTNIVDFPNAASINREYNISVPSGTYTATLRLHYEDGELNGNNESAITNWKYSAGTWIESGKTGNNTTSNYVEQGGLSNISYKWTCSQTPGVVNWNGSVSSDWNNAGNWTTIAGAPSMPPGSNDIVQIGTTVFGNQPTISNAVTVKSILFGSMQSALLTVAAGGSLTTYGNINGNWSAEAVHTIDIGDQNMTVNGSISLSNNINNQSINLNIGSGTLALSGIMVQAGNASVIITGTGVLSIGENFIYTSGTFTPGNGTVIYNGTGAQALAGVNYHNLIVNKFTGIATLPDMVFISGNFSVSSGTLELGTSVLNITGDVNISSGANIECNGGTMNVGGNWANEGIYFSTTGSVIINGTGAQSISSTSFNNFIINKSSGTASLTGNITMDGDLSLQSGILDLLTYTANKRALGGTVTVAAGSTLVLGGSNNFPAGFTTNSISSTSLVHYNGVITQSILGVNYGDLTLSNGGTNAKTQIAATTISGNLTINSGATFNSGGFSTFLAGNWVNNGTFTASTGTVILNGVAKTMTGNNTFNKVTVNGSYAVASNLIFNGLLWVTAGASFVSSGSAIFNGDLTNNGTLVGNGITTFTGTSVQTIRLVNAILSSSTGVVNFNGNVSPVLNSTSSPRFATLNINNTAGLNPSVGATIFVALNINAGGVMNGGNSTHTIYGSFTNNGTITSTGTLNFLPATAKTIALGNSGFSSDGVVNFGGAGQITITGTPGAFKNLIISNTNAAGVSASSNWIIDSNFVVTQNAIFNGGSYTYTVGGNIESDGTMNGGTSTFIMTSPEAEVSVSAETVFNNLTISGAAILTPQTDFRVAGNFTNNGVYDGTVGVLIMSGSTAGTIAGTTTPSTIAQLTIEKTGGATVTQNVNISALQFLNVFSGTFYTATYSLTQDAGGGILIINSDATLKLGGTNSLPGFSGYGLDVNSNVDYAGVSTTQAIGNAAMYGNLIISGTGNKNALVSLTVQGNLTMTAGTLNTNTSTITHSIAGNFIMTGSSTITGTNSTYVLNGDADQTLTLLSNLGKLTINKSGGFVSLGSNITINSILNFTSGKIRTGSYSVIIPATGTLTGAAQNKGWVIGNLQKNVATGSSVSRTFEVGSQDYYSPATVLFASVSTAGNLIVNVTATDHTQVDYSGLDSTKSVNRFWGISNSGIAFTTATTTFNWVASDLNNGVVTSNLKTALYNGIGWSLPTTASALATSIQATGLTGFGDFVIAEVASEYVWTGAGMSSDWADIKNWSGGVPMVNLPTIIPAGLTGGRVYPVLNSGTAAVQNLTIQSGASLTITNATLQITGTISNSGILAAAAGTIELKGSTNQAIPAGMFENNLVHNLIVSNNVSLDGICNISGILTVSGEKTFTTNNHLVLKSDANGTARIAALPVNGSGEATAFITGNVSIERYIPARRVWRLLSAPVSSAGAPTINAAWQEGATTASANPNPNPGYGTQITGGTVANGFDQIPYNGASIKYYNNATGLFMVPSSTNVPITNYAGYFLFVRGDRGLSLTSTTPNNTVLRMKGQVFTGNKNIPLTPGGYSLVGNPFASAINFATLTRTNVSNTVYIWDPKLGGSNGVGGYVTGSWNDATSAYDFTSSVSPVSQYIPSGEAFFVMSPDNTQAASITIKESDKTTSGSDELFGFAGTANSSVRVDLFGVNANGSRVLADGFMATYFYSNSNSVDADDANKVYNSGENISLLRNGKVLSIERRKMVEDKDTLFINMIRMKQQTYQMDIIAQDMGVNSGMVALLKDNLAGSLLNDMPLNLSGVTTVSFVVTSNPATYAANRFSIVFKPVALVPVTIQSISASKQQNDIVVKWQVQNQVNIAGYDVETSADGRNFTKAATIQAKPTAEAYYNWTDLNVSTGMHYYRVKANGENSDKHYSSIVKVNVGAGLEAEALNIFPNNVAGSNLSLQVNSASKEIYIAQIFNAAGQLVQKQTISHNGGSVTYNISLMSNLSAGKYYIRLQGTASKLSSSFIKQ